jgi:hypothetical protein
MLEEESKKKQEGSSIKELVKYHMSELEGLFYKEFEDVKEKVTNTKEIWDLLNEKNKNVKEKDRYIPNRNINLSNRFILH